MTTPEPECLDERMRGTGCGPDLSIEADFAADSDYDEAPEPGERLAGLVTQPLIGRLIARLNRIPDSDALMVEKHELRVVLLLAADAERLTIDRDRLLEQVAAWHNDAESMRAQRDAMETALNTANATIHRVETVRCWENEDRKWFAFRDDLYESLHGEQPDADLRAARDMLRKTDPAPVVVHPDEWPEGLPRPVGPHQCGRRSRPGIGGILGPCVKPRGHDVGEWHLDATGAAWDPASDPRAATDA